MYQGKADWGDDPQTSLALPSHRPLATDHKPLNMHNQICESCGRDAEFTVYRGAGASRKAECCLCRACAEKVERTLYAKGNQPPGQPQEILTAEPCIAKRANERPETCPNCGNSAEEIVKSGIVGCETCYEAFTGEVEAAIKAWHGDAIRHAG